MNKNKEIKYSLSLRYCYILLIASNLLTIFTVTDPPAPPTEGTLLVFETVPIPT